MGPHAVRRREVCLVIGLVASSAACVEGFRGSNVQIDFAPITPVQASPGTTVQPDELPTNAHLKLYGIQIGNDRDRLFELQRFELHTIVDIRSPCFIDAGAHVPHPGLHVSQYAAAIAVDTGIPDFRNPPPGATEEQKIDAATAAQRMANVSALGGEFGIKVVSSASEGGYPAVAADCSGGADEIPPPMCMDEDSNARRLELCQAAWAADDGLWEGTDRVLTAPLAGTTYGMVDGMNPINLAPVGGAQFFVDESLDTMDAFAVYWQMDGVEEPGTLLLFGKPETATRGARHVQLQSPSNPNFTSEMVIFSDLDDDKVQF